MNITMIARHCCIRVHKMGLPLRTLGHNIGLITSRYPTQVQGYYDWRLLYENMKQLWNAIALIDPVTHIYHIHNEPNYFVSAVKEASRKPVIMDVHDSYLARRTDKEKETRRVVQERNNMLLADGFVFVNEAMQKTVYKEFPMLKEKPAICLYSYVPRDFYVWDFFDYRPGVCYEGRTYSPETLIKENGEKDFFEHSDYTSLCAEMKEQKVPFWIYNSTTSMDAYYKPLALIGGSYHYNLLINKIGRHDWGLLGNNQSFLDLENCMPNKLFEYVAAQLPIVAMNAKFAGDWLEQEGIGISVKSLEELKSRYNERNQCRENLIKQRLRYCMEAHINKLVGLYREVLKQCGT